MHLSYVISPDRRTLTITADAAARAELAALPDCIEDGAEWPIGSNAALYDAFEQLICNSGLEWIAPEVCGDLTDAPILGLFGSCEPRDNPGRDGFVLAGRWDGIVWGAPVVERWAYLGYMVRSPLEDLRDTGRAVFMAP